MDFGVPNLDLLTVGVLKDHKITPIPLNCKLNTTYLNILLEALAVGVM